MLMAFIIWCAYKYTALPLIFAYVLAYFLTGGGITFLLFLFLTFTAKKGDANVQERERV